MTVNSWGSDDPAEVAKGGTGRASHTAYAVICGGTTTTAAQQSIANVGTAGQVLTSNGAGALPTFQNPPSGGGAKVFLNAQTASSSASIEWDNTYINSTYDHYVVEIYGMNPANNNAELYLRLSNDNGSTFETSNYDGSYYRASSTSRNDVSNDFRCAQTIGTVGNEGNVNCVVHIFNPEPSTLFTTYLCQTGYIDGSNDNMILHGTGQYEVAETINAIQFSADSGNIADGRFVLYGISES